MRTSARSGWRVPALGVALSLLVAGCGVEDPGGLPPGPSPDLPGEKTDSPLPDAPAYLEVYALDIWGQPLPRAGTTLGIACAGQWLTLSAYPVGLVPLAAPANCSLRLTAPQHEDLVVTLKYDGTNVVLGPPPEGGPHGLSMTHEQRAIGALTKPVHTIYLGLRHKWFSAQGRPARHGNQIELLMDGEQAWSRAYPDLVGASESVLASTWWWESNFELVRDKATHASLTPEQRWKNTILGILEGNRATKRVLVGQFWGQDSILAFMTSDDKLRKHAEDRGDGFEFMGQANRTSGEFLFEVTPFMFKDRVTANVTAARGLAFDEEPAVRSTVPGHKVDLSQWPIDIDVEQASYHQKFMVIDHKLAYIGGMNFRRVDWDTTEHKVFEPRRMLFDASKEDREAVARKEKLPDMGPRKDYVMRVLGPSAQDAADVFHERWRYALDQKVDYAANSTDFGVVRDVKPVEGGLQVQVTATLPKPFWEHAIAETWFNAVRNASDYIYIEDQYFRIPMLVDEIIARMRAVPTLRLVVVTKPINEWTDPGCAWSYRTAEMIEKEFADRFQLLQLRSFDTMVTWGIHNTEARWGTMDTHAKIMIVDDIFVSVGSCNKNNRGLIYEAELNVAVADPAFAKATRKRLLAAILPPGAPSLDATTDWYEQVRAAAQWNDTVYKLWRDNDDDLNLRNSSLPPQYVPRGFIYNLDFRAVKKCFLESIGPDMV